MNRYPTALNTDLAGDETSPPRATVPAGPLPLTVGEADGILHDLRVAGWSEEIIERLVAAMAALPVPAGPEERAREAYDLGYHNGYAKGVFDSERAALPVPAVEPLTADEIERGLATMSASDLRAMVRRLLPAPAVEPRPLADIVDSWARTPVPAVDEDRCAAVCGLERRDHARLDEEDHLFVPAVDEDRERLAALIEEAWIGLPDGDPLVRGDYWFGVVATRLIRAGVRLTGDNRA